MALVLNGFALPGLVGLAAALAMAALVFGVATYRRQNRRLALIMFLEGCALGSGAGMLYMMTTPADAFAAQSIFVTSHLAMPYAYLLFLATIDVPLSRPLQHAAAPFVLLALALATEAYWLRHPLQFIPGLIPVWYAPWEAILGETFLLFWAFNGLVSLYGLAIAVSAFRRARPDAVSRARARSYALAFGARDAGLFLFFAALPLFIPVPPAGGWTDALYIWGYSSVVVLFVGLVGYGILKSQLFDIDLRLKITISRTALAAIFLAVFFVVAQLAQNWLTESYGWALGGMAAGLLLFALNPLQHVATRIADTAMPRVQATDEYLSFRKLQVYRAALEGAAEDGRPSHQERAMLARLQKELGIRPEDATRLELDVWGPPVPT